MSVLMSIRVLGAELFAVEFLANPPDDPPKLEGGAGGQVEMGEAYQPGDVYLGFHKPSSSGGVS